MQPSDDMPPEAQYDAFGRAVKPRAKRANPERDQQRAVVQWARRVLPIGTIVQHVKNEAAPNSTTKWGAVRFHAARKKDGLVWGFPDLIALLPGGQVLLIEMKAPRDGVVSEAQIAMHNDLRAIGHRIGIATCIETARYLMHEWGVRLREHPDQPMRPAVVRLAKASRTKLPADQVPF